MQIRVMQSNLFPRIKAASGQPQVVVGWKGLNIGIEYQPGDVRHGRIMQVSYGHIQNYVGADKDALDVYLGNKPASVKVFQIDQLNKDGTFDEHKFMLWFGSIDEAIAAYCAHMPFSFFGGCTEVKLSQLEKYRK